MKKQIMQNIFHDLGVICTIGVALDVVLFVLAFAVTWLASGLSVLSALAGARSVLLVVGALLLFVCAGALLFGRKLDLRDSRRWTNYFRVAGLFPVLLGVAVCILGLAVVIDYLIFPYI